MERLDFCSVTAVLRRYISEDMPYRNGIGISQIDFLYILFDGYFQTGDVDNFVLDNGLVCRWMNGQAKVSPRITGFYLDNKNKTLFVRHFEENILPLFFDAGLVITELHDLLVQDNSISEMQRQRLNKEYPCDTENAQAAYIVSLLMFGMERNFVKRETKARKLLTVGNLSPLDEQQTELMRCLSLVPLSGIPAKLFAAWTQQPDMNQINNLVEMGFIQPKSGRMIGLHPMLQEITVTDTRPSVTNCRTMMDYQREEIFYYHGIEVPYFKLLFATVLNMMEILEIDDKESYLRYLEDAFTCMDKYIGRKNPAMGNNDLAARYMKQGIAFLEQYGLVYMNQSVRCKHTCLDCNLTRQYRPLKQVIDYADILYFVYPKTTCANCSSVFFSNASLFISDSI